MKRSSSKNQGITDSCADNDIGHNYTSESGSVKSSGSGSPHDVAVSRHAANSTHNYGQDFIEDDLNPPARQLDADQSNNLGKLSPDQVRHYSPLNIGDSKSPAYLQKIDGNAKDSELSTTQMHHNGYQSSQIASGFVMNGYSKIEAPTSRNIEPYLNSLAQRGGENNNLPPELDRKQPPESTNNIQQTSRGRQRYRHTIDPLGSPSDGFVPLQFVHVPNTNNGATLNATKRAPSVPDLISYLHNQRHIREEGVSIPPLSDETLRNKERQSRKEEFEERLRMAHFRLNSDAESSLTRYRSKSTPSRGGIWASGSRNQSGNAQSTERQSSYSNIIRGGDTVEATLIPTNLRQLESTGMGLPHANEFRSLGSVEQPMEDIRSSPPPALIVTTNNGSSPQRLSTNAVEDVLINSSVKSSDGSHRVRTLSGASSDAIPEPPPPPPPATEKERLVQREREARFETERARRRHLALLRERQLEENDGREVENEGSDHAGILGQVSFDGVLQSAPEFVGDSVLALDLPPGSSSVGSSASIPRPPLPTPPAITERERLVERERQARLETEFARRRHLALQRERQLEEDQDDSISGGGDMQLNGQANHCPMPDSMNGEVNDLTHATEEIEGDDDDALSVTGAEYTTPGEIQVVQNTDNEPNSLSYPMERFIAEGERPDMVPIAPMDTPVDNDAGSLPYTMELFLAESAVPSPSPRDDMVSGNIRTDESVGGEHSENDLQLNDDNTEPPIEAPAVQTNLELNPNECLDDEQRSHAGSAASITSTATHESFTGESAHLDNNHILDSSDDIGGEFNVNNSWVANAEPSQSHVSTAGSNESLQSSSHQPHLTEADIAQLDEVVEFHADNSWAANAEPPQSHLSTAGSNESLHSSSHQPHLTEALLRQTDEVEGASIGNAPPQSLRDEPSEPSVVGRGDLGPFSVATQTTVIESMTEASHGRGVSTFSEIIDESVESLNVIRINSAGSIQTPSASSASIEAMPSSDSSTNSNDISPPHSELISDSLSHSVEPSQPSSDNQMPRLTEADVVAMDDLDYASIGNAPPHSVRDERLSESSVIGRQFGTIAEIGSIDEHTFERDNSLSVQPENASVEAMPSVQSNHSIEAMSSEDGGGSNIMHDSGEIIVYQASDMGSSASIQALPSVDLETEAGLNDFNYGSFSAENALRDPRDDLSVDRDGLGHDIESAPLLPTRTGEREAQPGEEKEMPNDGISPYIQSLVLITAELPTFFIIIHQGEQLISLIGIQRYQLLLAALVVATSTNQGDKEQFVAHCNTNAMQLKRYSVYAEMPKCIFTGVLFGSFVGLLGAMIPGTDIWFGVVMFLSISLATVLAGLVELFYIWVLQNLNENHSFGRKNWVEPVLKGCQDFVLCLTTMLVTSLLLSHWPIIIDENDEIS